MMEWYEQWKVSAFDPAEVVWFKKVASKPLKF
jgi:hypothetical protein